MKKILITGANGFLGSNLVKYLSNYKEYSVFAMVRPAGAVNFLYEFQKDPESGKNLFELVEANLTDDLSVEKAIGGMDVVIHLAGMVTDWGSKEDFYNLNVAGTERVLRGAAKAGVSKVIYLSSLTVHSMDGHTYSDESAPCDMQAYQYGITKKMGEDRLYRWLEEHSESKVQGAVVRPGFLIYGSYDKNTFINVIDAVKNGTFGFINGGKSLISYVHAENLCYGINQLIEAPEINGAYNILDGNKTWKEWIKLWADALGVKAPRLTVPYWFMVPVAAILEGAYKLFKSSTAPVLTLYRIRIMHKNLAFSGKRMQEEIGYTPPVSLEKSVEKTLDFYKRSR